VLHLDKLTPSVLRHWIDPADYYHTASPLFIFSFLLPPPTAIKIKWVYRNSHDFQKIQHFFTRSTLGLLELQISNPDPQHVR